MSNALNPDSVMLQQVDGQWQKLAALIIWKLVGRDKPVTITAKDIEAMQASFSPGMGVILTHGHFDSIEFSLIDETAARRVGSHDAAMRGRA